MIKALFKPNIFTNECFEYEFDLDRESLDNIIKDIVKIDQTGLPKNKDLLYNIANYVEVNNILIPKEKWKDYYAVSGDTISLVFLPMGSGGGDKSTLAAVLGAVLAVIATVASFGAAAGVAALGGSVLLANLAGAAAGTIVSVAGGLAMNALFPAEAANDTEDIQVDKTQYSISGGRNDLNPYGAIPVVLGKIKVTPYYYRPTFFESIKGLQYLSSGFVWGYADNGLKIESVKIGDTPIEQFSPQKYITIVDTKPSTDDDTYKIQSEVNLELIGLDSTDPKGDYLYRTVKDTYNIIIDLSFPQGLYSIQQNGEKGVAECLISISYRPVGTDKWISLSGGETDYPETFIVRMVETKTNNKWADRWSGVFTTSYNTGTFYIIFKAVKKDNYISSYDLVYATSFTSDDIILYEYNLKKDVGARGWYYERVDRRPDKTQLNIVEKVISIDEAYDTYEPDVLVRSVKTTDLYISAGKYILPDIKIVDNKTSVLNQTFDFPVDRGDYELKVAKMPNSYTTAQTVINRVVWVSYGATYKEPSFKYKYPLATTYLYMQANEKLNGVVDALTGVCTSILYDYNHETKKWEIRATNNPASLILYVLTGNPNAKRLKFNNTNDINADWDSIDKASFEKFHDYCRLNKHEYNRYITESVGVWELVQQIASTARAFISLISGKWAVVIDQKQDMVKAMVTPYNSWGASTTKNLPNIPHALRVSFYNEKNDYVADERIVYNDGYDENTAEDFQAQNIQGITNPDRIYTYAREMLKAYKLRAETHTVSMDWESLTLSLRDRVWFSYDYLKNAIGYGRIKEVFLNDSAQITGFLSDQYFTTEDGKTYGVMIRVLQNIISVEIEQLNNSNKVIFKSPQSINTGIEEGCIFSIGELNSMGSDCIVSKIERENDFVAKITLIDYAPEIYEEASKPVPPFDSNINTVRPSIKRPTNPFGLGLSVSYIEGYTGVEYYVNLTWNEPLNSPISIKEYEVESKETGLGWEKEGITKEVFLKMSKAPSSYVSFRVRAVGVNNTVSDWVELDDFTLEGAQLQPSDITPPINSVFRNGTLYIDWKEIFDLRPVQYEVRIGKTWEQSSLIGITSETEIKAEYDGIYWIKSKVYPNLYCKNAVSINVTNSQISTGGRLYKEIISEPNWSGEKVNFELVEGELETRAYQGIYTSHEQVMLNTPSKAYIYTQFDIESYSDQDIYKVADIYALTDVYARNLERDIYSIADIYEVSDIYAKGDGVGYDFQPQIQIFLNGKWSEWKNFTPDNYYGQGFNFRLIVTKENEDTLIRLLSFRIKIDVEDRTEIHNNIEVKTEGTEVLFNNPFNEPPSYQVSIIGGEGNETFEIEVFTDKAIIKMLRGSEYIDGKVNLLVMGF